MTILQAILSCNIACLSYMLPNAALGNEINLGIQMMIFISLSCGTFRYLGVGVVHIPCYAVFALIVKLKHLWLSKLFPGSCQFVR